MNEYEDSNAPKQDSVLFFGRTCTAITGSAWGQRVREPVSAESRQVESSLQALHSVSRVSPTPTINPEGKCDTPSPPAPLKANWTWLFTLYFNWESYHETDTSREDNGVFFSSLLRYNEKRRRSGEKPSLDPQDPEDVLENRGEREDEQGTSGADARHPRSRVLYL